MVKCNVSCYVVAVARAVIPGHPLQYASPIVFYGGIVVKAKDERTGTARPGCIYIAGGIHCQGICFVVSIRRAVVPRYPLFNARGIVLYGGIVAGTSSCYIYITGSIR